MTQSKEKYYELHTNTYTNFAQQKRVYTINEECYLFNIFGVYNFKQSFVVFIEQKGEREVKDTKRFVRSQNL